MRKRTVTALLILALLYLWGRLRNEQARADANADKAHKYDAQEKALKHLNDNAPDVVNPRSPLALRIAEAEHGLTPITWTDDEEEGA